MMIQKLLLTSWAMIGSVLAKGIPVCTEQNEWLGANMTTFQEPITDDISSFIFIDSPATISVDNSTCECAPVFGVVSFSMANGTWTWDNTTENCTLSCDRCQIYYCVYQFQDSLNNDFNVTVDENGTPTCVLPIEVTTTTTDVPTSTEVVTEEVSIEVNIQYMEGNTTTNYTLEYPVPTVVVTDTLDSDST